MTTPQSATTSLSGVYREHRDFVYRVTRQLGVAAIHAEDVVHDVFVVVGERLSTYDGRGSLRSWLYGVTRRVVSHYHRGERRARHRLKLVQQGPTESSPRSVTDPEAEVARTEAADLVQRFAEQLPPPKRDVFVLSLVEGVPAPAIAEALDVNLNTIYARIRSVKSAFERSVKRQRLAQGGPR